MYESLTNKIGQQEVCLNQLFPEFISKGSGKEGGGKSKGKSKSNHDVGALFAAGRHACAHPTNERDPDCHAHPRRRTHADAYRFAFGPSPFKPYKHTYKHTCTYT